MRNIFIALALVSGVSAYADGYKCSYRNHHTNERLNVFIYNNTTGATRDAAVVILSNPEYDKGNRTIAVYRNATNQLFNQDGQRYTLNEDLRYTESRRRGENVMRTKLGEIDTFDLGVYFDYTVGPAVIRDGDAVDARITANFRKAVGKVRRDPVSRDLHCTRYVKGDVALDRAIETADDEE
jgi:hypothetical protein